MKTSQPPAIGARPLSLDNGCSTNQVLERGGHEIPRAHRFTIDVWEGVFRCLRISEDRSGDPSAAGLRPDRSKQRPLHLRAHVSDDCRERKSIASHSSQCCSVRRSVRRRPETTDRIRLRRSISGLLCGSGLGCGWLLMLRPALVSVRQHHKPPARHASTLTPVAHNALAHTKLSGKFSNAASHRDCMFEFVHAPIITYVFRRVNTNELSQW